MHSHEYLNLFYHLTRSSFSKQYSLTNKKMPNKNDYVPINSKLLLCNTCHNKTLKLMFRRRTELPQSTQTYPNINKYIFKVGNTHILFLSCTDLAIYLHLKAKKALCLSRMRSLSKNISTRYIKCI